MALVVNSQQFRTVLVDLVRVKHLNNRVERALRLTCIAYSKVVLYRSHAGVCIRTSTLHSRCTSQHPKRLSRPCGCKLSTVQYLLTFLLCPWVQKKIGFYQILDFLWSHVLSTYIWTHAQQAFYFLQYVLIARTGGNPAQLANFAA